MRFPIRLWLLAVVFLLPQTIGARISGPGREDVKRSVVKVTTADESGAGLILSNKEGTTFILTAYHVVKDAKKVTVTFFDRKYQPFSAKVLNFNEDLDIAVIKVEKVPFSQRALRLTVTDSPVEGGAVMTVGHPADLDWQFEEGEIVRLDYRGDSRKFLHTSPNLQRGNSGGPVFLKSDGKLLGLVIGRGPSGHAGCGDRLSSEINTERLGHSYDKSVCWEFGRKKNHGESSFRFVRHKE